MDETKLQELQNFHDQCGCTLSLADLSGFVNRDRLISVMLQERTVLRLISAPHGFGKSFLAFEYAHRMFAKEPVAWIDAAAPDFLRSLDQGSIETIVGSAKSVKLVILDAVPYLDEQRRQVLSRLIDLLLYRGVEVIATVLPSNDCMRFLQTDRILIHASDLLVTDDDCRRGLNKDNVESHMRIMHLQQRASLLLFGKVPSLFWGDADRSLDRCLTGFFEEKLPVDMMRCVFGMLLVGTGSFDDLARMELVVDDEMLHMLVTDYPFLGADPVKRSFEIAAYPYSVLRSAIEDNGLSQTLIFGQASIPERALSVLLRRGDTQRASDILSAFCSDERCAAWLRECGWSLLDRMEYTLIGSLFERTEQTKSAHDAVLKSIHAWYSGLMGDRREALYYARSVLESRKPDTFDVDTGAIVMAYFALLAFGDAREHFWDSGMDIIFGPPVVPEDFLALVAQVCTTVELARALCLDDESLAQLESSRVDADEGHVQQIQVLFTDNADRFGGTTAFRLALHILHFVDADGLQAMRQDFGCGVIVEARRNGLTCITQALVIRDLWVSGYFGRSSRTIDSQDALLLEQTGAMLKRLGQTARLEHVTIPWELGTISGKRLSKGEVKVRSRLLDDDIALVQVGLFGGFEVTVGDKPIAAKLWRKKSRLLFIGLVLNQGRDVARTDILKQLWPQCDNRHATDNFYTVWSNVVSLLGKGPYVERTGKYCRINSRYVTSDIAEFEQLIRSLLMRNDDTRDLLDTYARLESLYRGGLLPSEHGNLLITQQRERYASMFTDAMVTATTRSLEIGDARLALWFARKGMETGHNREDVYYVLIRAQIAAGQRCSAISSYFKCRDFLRDELGLDPSIDTQDLYERLIAVDPSLMSLDPAAFRK